MTKACMRVPAYVSLVLDGQTSIGESVRTLAQHNGRVRDSVMRALKLQTGNGAIRTMATKRPPCSRPDGAAITLKTRVELSPFARTSSSLRAGM